jgi:RNA polymerase sigma-70 factor (ECF subfamily)
VDPWRARLFCESARVALPAPADALEATLESLVGGALKAWPRASIDEAGLLQELGRRLQGNSAPLERATALHASDVLLAVCCAKGESWAQQALEDGWIAPMAAELRRLERLRVSAEDALQLLREKVLLRRPNAPPRIAEYAGLGPLKAWLKAVALRAAISAARGKGEGAAEAWPDAPGRDVELDYLHARYREPFREAFNTALGRLSKRQRSLLRFQAVDGLSIDQIGSIYHAHRSTAARWLADARALLLEETRRELAERLSLVTGELDSMMDLLAGRLDVSITGFLRRGR